MTGNRGGPMTVARTRSDRSHARGKRHHVQPSGAPCQHLETGCSAMRSHPLGTDAAVIGRIAEEPERIVLLETTFGGTRIVDMLVGDPLPRIC